MIEKNVSGISIDEIIQKIREEIDSRKTEEYYFNKQDKTIHQMQEGDIISPRIQEAKIWRIIEKIQYKFFRYDFYSFVRRIVFKFIPRYNEYFIIEDFLKYHDEEFIKNAYRGILKRKPDSEGLSYYLLKLRSGRLNKIEILGKMRYSKEGKVCHTKIKKLFLRFLIELFYHIPLIGYILKLLMSITKFPKISKNI